MALLRVSVIVLCFQIAAFTDPPCIIELECEECVPDNMPVVTSHGAGGAGGGAVRVAAGEELRLSCGGGAFLAYPSLRALAAVCERGRYRVRHDARLRHLLELGCQEDLFEDVLHSVEGCGAPLQGRAYQRQQGGGGGGGGARHVATLCFDEDRGVAVRARAGALALPPHSDASAPLSLLGNFNHMFDARTRRDAERLYSDDARLNRRLHELFKHERVAFAGQSLTAGRLLAPQYFEEQEMRAADFASNKVAVWRSVAEGNLRHLQEDVSRLLRRAPALQLHAGTHGVMALRAGDAPAEVFLRAGGRFPVPKYIWTAVVDPRTRRGLALVLLNDPFVAVSEVRAAVFCDSGCGRAAWLRELRRHRHYESGVYGLVFCCGLHNFTAAVPELPAALVAAVAPGDAGLLTELPV